jgi:O-antigen/teichoic acid export membrane protein
VTLSKAPSRTSLTTQAFWLLAAKTAGFFFALVFPLFLVRLLDQSKYGTYKQMFLLISTAQSVLSMGFGLSAFYFFPREPERRGAVSLNIVLFHVAIGTLAALTLTLWPNCLVLLFANKELAPYAPKMGIVILLRMASAFLEYVATAQEDVKCSTIFIVAAQFTKSVVMLSALFFAGSLSALLYGSMFQGVLQIAVLAWYLERSFPGFWKRVDWPLFRAQLAYAIPLGMAGVLYLFRTEAHNYFVAHSVGAAAFAIYAVGCADIPLVGLVREAVGTVLIRRISELHHAGSYREVLLLTIRGMQKLSLFFWPLYAYLLVMSREVIRLLYTRRYDASVPIFAINITLIPLTILVLDPVLRAFSEHIYFLVRLQVFLLLVMGVALLIVIPAYGPVGAILVVVASSAIELGAITWKVARVLKMSLEDLRLASGIFKLGLSAAAAGVVTSLVRRTVVGYHPALMLAVCGCAFLPVYAAGAYFSRAVPREEVQELVKLGRRVLRLA